MKFGIVVFPGSNCDEDCHHVAKDLLGCEAEYIWHHDRDLKGADAVILPGGFAYGDYLRAGALARFSPVMESVAEFAKKGGAVLGICNGFQVLLEAGLLPGAMQINRGLRYVCRDVYMKVENDATPFTRSIRRAASSRCRSATWKATTPRRPRRSPSSEREGRVVFRYCDPEGRVVDSANPNGATDAIAGICNREGNVVGLMPHPDRCSEGSLARQRRRASRCSSPRCRRHWRRDDDGASRRDVDQGAQPLRRRSTRRILEILGREPNLVELGIFSAMWSEHCSYKSSRIHLKKFPTTGPRVIQGPGENAGVVDIGDGLAVALQDGVAQPPVLHRAVPGRGDRRRRHPARRLHDGRAADGLAELAALRPPRRAADEAPRGRRRARHRRLRQLHRHPDGRRRDDASTRATTATSSST